MWPGGPVTGHNVVNTKKWVRSTIYSLREYNTFMLITLKGYVIMGPFISSKTFNNSSTLSYMYMYMSEISMLEPFLNSRFS